MDTFFLLRGRIKWEEGTYKGRCCMVCNAFLTWVEPLASPSRVLNVPGRTMKPARRIQVNKNERMLYTRGTSSNTMSVYCDFTILPPDTEVPSVTDLFGTRRS